MGRRNRRQRQKGLWVAATDLPQTAAHPFYHRLNKLLDEHGFDEFAEQHCAKFYAPRMGRPSLTPGSYFRCLLVGYFEGIDGERGIAWRLADSISLRRFLAIELDESTPDHSTISRTRRLIDVETHRQVFTWVLQLLAQQGLLKGATMAVDATTLEANAALRSIVRRDSGERVERSFAHLYEPGRMRRTHLRGHENILKRLLIHGGAFNLSLVLRKERGAGTPRGLAEAKKAFDWLWKTVRRPFSARQALLLGLWTRLVNGPFRLDSPPRICGPARTA